MNKIIIITAPSGAGKTTIVKELLKRNSHLTFSISACTRIPRNDEMQGVDYYFLTEDNFKSKIEENAFLEWEMVYPGKYYGTLKAEIERIENNHHVPLVDIDVKGALNIKRNYKSNSISIFIKAPSIDVLKERLIKRATENEKGLLERLQKAKEESTYEQMFDHVVVNGDLNLAIEEINQIVADFIGG